MSTKAKHPSDAVLQEARHSSSSHYFRFVALCVLAFHGIYETLRYLFENDHVHSFMGWKRCSDEDACTRSDLFAFQGLSGSVFVVCGSLGLYSWRCCSEQIMSPEMRLFGHNPYAELLTLLNLSYQIWDFAVSLTIPEHCTLIMMTHHAVAGILAWSAVYNEMMGFYAIFFLGISEVSSIFLVTVDVARFFENGTILDTFVEPVSGPLFAVTFIYFRVIRWWPVSKLLWEDVRAVTKQSSSTAELLRPGRSWILYMWLFFNLPMGILQLYWTTLIYEEAKGVIGIHINKDIL